MFFRPNDMVSGLLSCPGVLAITSTACSRLSTLETDALMDWEPAVRAYNARVVASLVALSIPIEQAEELASQTWTRLIEKERAGQLKEISLPGLAIKQARFLAHAWFRSNRLRGALPEQEPAAGIDPERALIARREVEVALEVLSRSSPSAQAVFVHLYDDPPPTHQVVADRLGLSLQRVRQILCEVRRSIRVALEGNR